MSRGNKTKHLLRTPPYHFDGRGHDLTQSSRNSARKDVVETDQALLTLTPEVHPSRIPYCLKESQLCHLLVLRGPQENISLSLPQIVVRDLWCKMMNMVQVDEADQPHPDWSKNQM